MVDFRVTGGGSIYVLTPIPETAHTWIDQHLQYDSWQMCGGGVAVDHRYIADIVGILKHDGFVVHGADDYE